ncbi:MAG: DivIVA domain-containing protein [Ruminococcaceae bacterium]|nr:DivIVA domain-containing protein [Oscillospiraceae bacterium]
MFTPQQIQEISFDKVRKGGYDMDSVDEVLEPLTQDYLTLYQENSVLKSKLRILVEKLEEYRRQEGSMKNAILSAQKTSEQMIIDTEKKCAQMLREAEQTAQDKGNTAEVEEERLQAAKQMCDEFFDSMQKRLQQQMELLSKLRTMEPPKEATPAKENRIFDFDTQIAPTEQEREEALIEAIGQNIEERMSAGTLGEIGGMTIRTEPLSAQTQKMPEVPQEHHVATPRKFEDLKFGKNYNPNEN